MLTYACADNSGDKPSPAFFTKPQKKEKNVDDNKPECFLTDKRYTCFSPECRWRRECKKLKAEWLRR